MTRHIIVSTSLKQLTVATGRQANVDDLIWQRGSKGLQHSRFLALQVRRPGSPLPPVLTALGRNCPGAGCWFMAYLLQTAVRRPWDTTGRVKHPA